MEIDYEDNFLYDSDPESDEGYCYGSDQDYDNNDDDLDAEFDEHVCSQTAYTVLNESDIQQRQYDEISHVSAVLSVSEATACLLLCHYRWNVSRLHEQWFADETNVRAMVGLLSSDRQLPPAVRSDVKELICGICFDSLPQDQFFPTVCGHFYCVICWKNYISVTINDGPGSLSLRCPEPSCHCAMGRDIINELASDGEKLKYSRYFLRTYVEGKKTIKWCPGPGCENAVELEPDSSVYEVTCSCSYVFCWNCTEDAHRPLDCDTVAKWILKNNSEAENNEWMLAKTKPCPECKCPIEKNHGCMHMTCTEPCKFQFCWLCLGSWFSHTSETGGNYACNRYEDDKQKGLYNEEEKRREMAQKYIERYTHYYERWAGNQQSRLKATYDLHKAQTVDLEELSNKVKIPEDEHTKKRLFEYLQGLAENALERLHLCTEKDFRRRIYVWMM